MLHIVADLNADGAPDLLMKQLPFPEATTYAHYNLATVPDVSLTLPFSTLPFGVHALLEGGNPSGGSWSGEGVVGDSLFTELAMGWPILVTYSYTTEFGCTASAEALVDIVTGLPETKPNTVLLPYPQPADELVRVPVADPDATVQVHDATGRLMSPLVTRHADHLRIATDQLPSGTYVLSLIVHDRPAGHGRLLVVH
jgi:hypothetical protein